jgi:hypothetical protein
MKRGMRAALYRVAVNEASGKSKKYLMMLNDA